MDEQRSRVGTRFGPYELRSLLGRGGMGEVYEAFDTGKGRVVALKLLPTDLAADPMYQQRFRNESRAAARLAEPHVIPIHDWGEIDGVLYIDMRLVRGRDLRSVLREEGALTPARAVAVIEQIADALDAAHAEGLVHRDVKPANILVTASDFAYLADFGIARSVDDPTLTDTGTAVGSFSYIAPERLDDVPLTGSADVYSLACVLYESLTGTLPFPATVMSALVRAHLSSPPPRPSAADPGVPAALDGVVARGMAKTPEQRYPTARALALAARAALTAPPPAPATVCFPAVESRVPPPPGSAVRRGQPAIGAEGRRPPGGVIGPAKDGRRVSNPSGPSAPTEGFDAPAPEGSRITPVAGRAEAAGGGPTAPTEDFDASGPARANPPAGRFVPAAPPSRGGARESGTSAPTEDFGAGERTGSPAAGSPDATTRNFGAAASPSRTPVPPGPPPGREPGSVGRAHSSAGGPHAPTVDLNAITSGRAVPTTDLGALAGRVHPAPPGGALIGTTPPEPRPRPGTEGSGGRRFGDVHRRVDETAVTLQRAAVAPDRIDTGSAAAPPGPPRVTRSRSRWIAALAVLSVVVLAGVVAARLLIGSTGEAPADGPRVPVSATPLPTDATPCPSTEPTLGRYASSASGSTVTSCPFAEAVRTAYGEPAGDADAARTVTATSPINGREYSMHCTAGPGFVTCAGGDNAVVYLY